MMTCGRVGRGAAKSAGRSAESDSIIREISAWMTLLSSDVETRLDDVVQFGRRDVLVSSNTLLHPCYDVKRRLNAHVAGHKNLFQLIEDAFVNLIPAPDEPVQFSEKARPGLLETLI
jgi:hypothetical protein